MTISPINLGSFYTSSNGTQVSNGISSGLDTNSLITALTSAQTAQITSLNDEVKVNTSQTSALSNLNQILTTLQSAITPLSNPTSPDSSENLFAVSTSTVTSNTSQAASNYLTTTVASGTASGTYIISNVTQLATTNTQETNAFTLTSADASVVPATPTAGYFSAGTITVKGQPITIKTGDSLSTIAQDFNNVSSTTGISASVLETSAGQYKLIFTSTTTGAAANFNLTPALATTNATATIGAFASGSQTITFHSLPSADTALTATNSSLANGALSFTSSSAPAETTLANVALGTTTLNGLAAQINAVPGYSATVTQSGSDYALTVTQTAPGTSSGFDSHAFTGALSNYSSTVSSDPSGVLNNLSFKTDQQAQDASFDFNGVAVTRSTNNINDLVSGITVNLLQDTSTTPGASFTLTVAPDVNTIATGIANFATAYNNFLYFYSQQTALNSDSTPASGAVLGSDSTLRNIYNSVTTTVSGIVNGLAQNQPNTLDALGISFTDAAATTTTPATSNILSVDSSTLLSNLQTNFTGVEKVFGDSFTSSASDLLLYSNANDLAGITGFTLNVSQSTPPATYVGTYKDAAGKTQNVNFTASTLTTGGVTLTADPTSQLAGMALIYTGTSSESITVGLTQGIVSKLQSMVDSSVQASTGLIAQDTAAINAKNTAINTQVTTLTTQLNDQKQALLTKYTALEAAITQANSALSYLNAQQLAGQSNG